MIDVPTSATLKKYGLTQDEWLAMWNRQGGVCAICRKKPTPNPVTGKRLMNIDHEHVKSWVRLPPEMRKIYVRAILCWQCNRFHMFRGANAELAGNMADMLEEYELRRDELLASYAGPTQLSPPKKKRRTPIKPQSRDKIN